MGSYNDWQSVIVNFRKSGIEPEPEPEVPLDELVSLKYVNKTRELVVTVTGEVNMTYLISGAGDTKATQVRSEELVSDSRTFILEKDSVEKTHRFVFENGTQSRTVEFTVGKEEQK